MFGPFGGGAGVGGAGVGGGGAMIVEELSSGSLVVVGGGAGVGGGVTMIGQMEHRTDLDFGPGGRK